MKRVTCTLLFAVVLVLCGPVLFVQADDSKTRILLVPGHDAKSPGAIYGKLKEADMNLALGKKIFDLLKQDSRFEVYITRDEAGYTKEFSDYFVKNKKGIELFIKSSKERMLSNVTKGIFVEKSNTPHGLASDDAATKLYAFNKWADVNDIDAVVHIHFNDNKRKTRWTMGKREGFAIYVPDEQFVNGKGSKIFAESIFKELNKNYAVSNYYMEEDGIVPDQKLIAVGANHTLIESVKAILVEYGYIYEFGNANTRQKAYKDMSELTVEGIKSYFFKQK